jgi:hypothetical protein
MFNLQARYQPWVFEKHLAHLDSNPWGSVRCLDSETEAKELLEIITRHNPATEYRITTTKD